MNYVGDDHPESPLVDGLLPTLLPDTCQMCPFFSRILIIVAVVAATPIVKDEPFVYIVDK